MDKIISQSQLRYLKSRKRQHFCIIIMRTLILVLLIGGWELCADIGVLNSFQQSFKNYQMFYRYGRNRHNMEASVGNRLRNSHMFLHRNCGRHAMRNVNVAVPDGFQNCRTIYCALEQSAQIGARTGSHSMARQQCKNHYRRCGFRCHIRCCFKHIYCLHRNRPGKNQINPYPRWQETAYSHQTGHTIFNTNNNQYDESKSRSFACRCDYW